MTTEAARRLEHRLQSEVGATCRRYQLLAPGDHTLYKADDLTAANFPRARMVLIRHKDVRFKVEAVAAV